LRGEAMARRHDGQQPSGAQETIVKARVSGDGDRQLNVARVKALVETCPALLDELERDARHGAPPAGEEACQALQHLRGRAETKHAGISGPGRPSLLRARLRVRQELSV